MHGKQLFFICLIISFSSVSAFTQNMSISYYSEEDYVRRDLFLEQDLIFNREVSYSQGLELICLQDKVKVVVNNRDTYFTPLDLNTLAPGEYSIELSKTGFMSETLNVTVFPHRRTSVIAELSANTGTLILENIPESSDVYINKELVSDHKIDVIAGEAAIEIRSFGYEVYKNTISIPSRESIIYKPEMKIAPFDILAFTVNRLEFGLTDSRSQKELLISLKTSAPGTGEVYLEESATKNKIWHKNFDIISWDTAFLLDIEDVTQQTPGKYNLVVNCSSGEIEKTLEQEIFISHGSQSRWRNVFTGSGGFLYAPDPVLLPPNTSQLNTSLTASFNTTDWQELNVPSGIAIRTSITEWLELSGGVSLYFSPELDRNSLDLYISAKTAFLQLGNLHRIHGSLLLGANYNGETASFTNVSDFDPFGGVTGISLAVPFSYNFKFFSFILSPEIRVSSNQLPLDQIYLKSYFRGALVLDLSAFSIAFSSTLESPDFLEYDNHWPLFCGLEFNFSPGKSQFSFGLHGGFRYLSGEDLNFTTGFSAGFMF